MEFNIDPKTYVKCNWFLDIQGSKNRDSRKFFTQEMSIGKLEEILGIDDIIAINHNDDVLALYPILRMLLPQTKILKAFKDNLEIDLYVGSSFTECEIITLPVPEEFMRILMKMCPTYLQLYKELNDLSTQ